MEINLSERCLIMTITIICADKSHKELYIPLQNNSISQEDIINNFIIKSFEK